MIRGDISSGTYLPDKRVSSLPPYDHISLTFLAFTLHVSLKVNSCLGFVLWLFLSQKISLRTKKYNTGFCSIINGSALAVRDCTNDLALLTEFGSLAALTCPVGLSCEKHTSGYKLWMFPAPITVNQQCMKQPHLLHRLLLFYCYTHVCPRNVDSFWYVLILCERRGGLLVSSCISGEKAESVLTQKSL